MRCRWLTLLGGVLVLSASPAPVQGVAPAPQLAAVTPHPRQPGGPAYGYLMGRFEVRNDQFVEFLNDALAHPNHGRGQYLYFDVDSGDVYLNSALGGTVGTNGGGTFIFKSSANPGIVWNAGVLQYQTVVGFESHPVVGVSWFGAVKYCNWLTLHSGMEPSDRIYQEAVAQNVNGWHPFSISDEDWTDRDLNSGERAALLGRRGFRLPMDGGDEGAQPGPYNEWFTAAAWHPQSSRESLYGFGRDSITEADANYRCSGDPFEDEGDCLIGGTTPVGFYNGALQSGGFQTRANANAFGIWDLSGNVWEWMQDQSFDSADRRNRGGSFRSGVGSLLAATGAEREAGAVNDSTGFRVVLVQEIVQGLAVIPDADFAVSGPWGGPYTSGPGSKIYRLHNVGQSATTHAVSADVPWLIAETTPPRPLAPGSSAPIEVTIAPDCGHGLGVGEHLGSLVVSAAGSVIQRTVSLTVSEPLTLGPQDDFRGEMFFGGANAAGRTFALGNQSMRPVRWQASTTDLTDPRDPAEPATWLRVNGGGTASGEIDGSASQPLIVDFAPAGLLVGEYQGELNLTDECTGEALVRTIRLAVLAPFSVAPEQAVGIRGICGGPFPPATLTLGNAMNQTLHWSVQSDRPDLASLSLEQGTVPGRGTASITIRMMPAADQLPVGQYPILLTFSQASTGYTVQRLITLDVAPVVVEPAEGLIFRGPRAGPFTPAETEYTLRNTGVTELEWSARFADLSTPAAPEGWLDIVPTNGTILNAQGEAVIALRPNAAATRLPPGTYTGLVSFTHDLIEGGCPATRSVTLTVGREAFALRMAVVPAEDAQSGGPTHRFRIGAFEVTHEAFARFLNEALEQPSSPLGQFLDHGSPPSGVVRLTGDGTLLFDAAQGGAIAVQGGAYHVVAGREQHPVTGVTWYGAAKFCNWMTLVQGMSAPDQRAYHEGPMRSDWYATALNAADWVAGVRGFRLPMDGGTGIAGPFNEWFKAAARQGRDAAGLPLFDARYGFGRSALGVQDANFADNGDTLDGGTTPVGFFNGVNRLALNQTLTRNTANGYGLYDLCGNVAEWIQDPGTQATERAVRGGHFGNAASSPLLRTDGRGSLPADQAFAFVGFRVAQTVDFVPLTVAASGVSARGFVGGPISPEVIELHIENQAPSTHDAFEVEVTADWLEPDGLIPQLVPPFDTLTVPFRVQSGTESPGLSPSPPGAMALISHADSAQPDGPQHDYWMGRYEVTNREFAEFLNDCLDRLRDENLDPNDPRTAHLYFDEDSGNVYMHDRVEGEIGPAAPTATISTKLYDAGAGRIRYSNAEYSVIAGFEDHPVTGVSWYGAVKYCNWLSLDEGVPAPLLAYAEAPSPTLDAWRPKTSPLQDEVLDRQAWVNDTFGYRLPMDESAPGPSLFNEWYRAAAWNGAVSDAGQNFLFGFGRDSLTNRDANFASSGDTTSEGTTPVGYFDGQHSLANVAQNCYPESGSTQRTQDTANAHRLYDLCGNVAEWQHDAGDVPSHRGIRGGSWRDSAGSPLLSNLGRGSRPAAGTYPDVGFRVVRGTGHVGRVTVNDTMSTARQHGYFLLDLAEPFMVTPRSTVEIGFRYGDSTVEFPPVALSYSIHNRSHSALDWSVECSAPWLDVGAAVDGLGTGAIEPGTKSDIVASTLDAVHTLPPGRHAAEIVVRNLQTGFSFKRTINLAIEPPAVAVTSNGLPLAFAGLIGGPFMLETPSTALTLENRADFSIGYQLISNSPWLAFEDGVEFAGTLAAGGTRIFMPSIGPSAADLAVGTYMVQLRFALTDRRTGRSAGEVAHELSLNVLEPLGINQAHEPWIIGPGLDAVALPQHTYGLAATGDFPLDVAVSSDAPWLRIEPSFAKVVPGRPVDIRASVLESALALPNGDYAAKIYFEDLLTGVVQCRNVRLDIENDLSVEPFEDFESVGIVGAGVTPRLTSYRLSNSAAGGPGRIHWRASVAPASANWILLNGAASAAGELDDGATTSLIIEINVDRANQLAPGTYEAEVEIVDLTNGEVNARRIRLTEVQPLLAIAGNPVDVAPLQPSGPAYPFLMGRYPVTNHEFVTFLNDARDHLDSPRGAYLYFDESIGGVYLNTDEQGAYGLGAAGRSVRVFSPSLTGQIGFSGGRFRVVTKPIDYARHPVAGVSWYGALKYCNWLTLDQGMLPSQRCYVEAPDYALERWHPQSITDADWSTRDLNDAERETLVRFYRGFRLPMDDGWSNALAAEDQADAYNEWFKAAAWNPLLTPPQNTTFAFGRNILKILDANFRDSGDSFDNGTTPVDFFDVTNANAFGIADLAGNVYAWQQDRFSTHLGNIAFRSIRGGSWNEAASATILRAASRGFTRPERVDGLIGFRVVRTVPEGNGDFDHDADVDLSDAWELITTLSGPTGVIFPAWIVFDFDGDGDLDLADWADFQRRFSGSF